VTGWSERERRSVALKAALLLLIVPFWTPQSFSQPIFSTEYDIKAALLFNLTQFTEWPARTFSDTNAPIVIGILGENPFGARLDKVVAGERVQNRPVITRYFNDPDEVKCHVLFISKSETLRVDRLISKFRGSAMLTVSDIDRFARRGGMVRFVTERGRVRFNINPGEVEAAGLKLSSKLLRIAEIVSTEK